MRKLLFLTPFLLGLLVMMACGDRGKSIIDDIHSPEERYKPGDSMLFERIQGHPDKYIAIYYQGSNMRSINIWDAAEDEFIVDTYVQLRGNGNLVWHLTLSELVKLNAFATPIQAALVKTLPLKEVSTRVSVVGHPTRTELSNREPETAQTSTGQTQASPAEIQGRREPETAQTSTGQTQGRFCFTVSGNGFRASELCFSTQEERDKAYDRIYGDTQKKDCFGPDADGNHVPVWCQ